MDGLVKNGALVLCTLLFSALVAPLAWAHDGAPIEEDRCVVRAGSYSLHITGYLPEVRGVEEFCWKIPSVGKTVLVLDFIQKGLRKIPVEFRIVENGDSDEAQTLAYIPPQTYPTGTLSTSVRFDAPGKYVGIVTVDGGEETMGRFSILIGSDPRGFGNLVVYAIVILAVVGVGVGLYFRGRKQDETPAA